jgi:hypothetical protein
MTAMARTIYLSVRGDGAWRVLEAFRRELGEEAATLVVHPSRDETGFYGSAEVGDPAAAREAFARARQLSPGLRAHLSAPPPESEEPPRRPLIPPLTPRVQPRPGDGGDRRARSERPGPQPRREAPGQRQTPGHQPEQPDPRGGERRLPRRRRRAR